MRLFELEAICEKCLARDCAQEQQREPEGEDAEEAIAEA